MVTMYRACNEGFFRLNDNNYKYNNNNNYNHSNSNTNTIVNTDTDDNNNKLLATDQNELVTIKADWNLNQQLENMAAAVRTMIVINHWIGELKSMT